MFHPQISNFKIGISTLGTGEHQQDPSESAKPELSVHTKWKK